MAITERRTETVRPPRTYARALQELDERRLVERARRNDSKAMQQLLRRYTGFVRIKASSYFLAGGDSDDLIQEGLIGLYKAVRDFRSDRESSFRSFAELCITRQIITAIKAATRNKHVPLNGYLSFSYVPAGQSADHDYTLGDCLPTSGVEDPASRVISTQELESLVSCLGERLSALEALVLKGYLSGDSYETVAARVGCEVKAVDNALQRVKRKVSEHLDERAILD